MGHDADVVRGRGRVERADRAFTGRGEVRDRRLPLVWAFNLVGLVDLVTVTARAARMDLPSMAGPLGAAFAIPILYVSALFWMHLLAILLLLQPARASVVPSARSMSLAR